MSPPFAFLALALSIVSASAAPLTGEAAIEHLKDTGQYDSLAAALTGARYGAKAADNAKAFAQNPAHDIRSTFTPEGLRFEVRTGETTHQVAWRLDSLGYGAAQIPVPSGELKVAGQRVEIIRGTSPTPHSELRIPHLVEWFYNTPGGLEHGFTLAERPAANPHGEALRLVLAVSGNLVPQADAAGQNVFLRDAAGQTVLTYAKLKVWDATGAELPATMLVADGRVTLAVADTAARYPITIDPTFIQQAYLKASNTGADDRFGSSVAVSGHTVVVGAPNEASNATGVNGNQGDDSVVFSGAAYVFVRSGTNWTQQAYLKASNSGAGDEFGFSVAVSGDTAVIGAYGEDSNATGVNGNQSNNSANRSGAAYVFVRSGTNWTQQAYLKASDSGSGNEFEHSFDNFGLSVAVSGDTVVVGATQESSNATGVNGNQANNSANASGAAYVFVRSGTTWTQQAYLKASNTGVSDEFGWSVAVSGDTAVVAAHTEDSNAIGVNGNQSDNSAINSGSAYVFVRSGTTWTQQAYLKASTTGTGEFGYSVAVSGDTAVVGAIFGIASGAAYVFVRSGTNWTQQAYLEAGSDLFGLSASVSGDTVVVGARGEDSNAIGVNGNQSDNSANNSGAAYVFGRSGTNWTQQAYLKASNTEADDQFGLSVAVSGDTVVVGANAESSNATGVNGNQTDNSALRAGAAYIFEMAKLQPVIFLHGVAGSVLKTSGSYIWPTIFPDDVTALNLQTGSANTEAVDIVREYDVGGLGQKVLVFYAPFIRHMVDQQGYTEFLLEEDRSRLTNFYMLNQAFSVKPTLFTFPYDWRKPNASHVDTLHRYIQKIRQLHDGAKVNLVVHSMGGLVMRRYLLEYGSEDVDKVVTVGSPIWGAPEVAYRMLTGSFFPNEAVDFINSRTMKQAIATMPAVHELLPSTAFLQNWGFPVFEEAGHDFNGNGLRFEGYDTSQFRVMLDAEASPWMPSLNSINFHSYLGGRQDNWSADSNSVKFLHIIGKQAVDVTTVGVKVEAKTLLSIAAFGVAILPEPHPLLDISRVVGEGDGTVPTLSSRRLPQHLAPGALVRDIFEPAEGVSSEDQLPGTSAEHTGLMANTEALGLISEFLGTGTLASPSAPPVRSLGAFKSAQKGSGPPRVAGALDAPEIVVEQPAGTNLVDGAASTSFGFVKPGNSSVVAFTIHNRGTTNLTGLAVTRDGTNSADFTVSNLDTTNLASLAATTFTVTFAPGSGTARTRSAALRIVSNDADENPFDIALTGATSPGRKHIAIMGSSYLKVRDLQGRENTRLSEIAARKIPGVDFRYGGEDPWMNVEFDSDTELTLAPDLPTEALEVEVIEFDNAGNPISLQRFRFAPGTNDWRMALLPGQAPDLKADQDRDGNLEPEEAVAPTHSSAGAAVDTMAPSIALEMSLAGDRIAVNLTGADGAQPAPTLRYSLDGGPVQTYSAPLDFPPGAARHLKLFAEDAMGNTSGLIETMINPAVSLVAGPVGTLAFAWPIADGYGLEEAATLSGPWVTSPAQRTRMGLQETVSLLIGSDERKFYRLRAQPVER